MKRLRFMIAVLSLAFLLALWSCGKKAPPVFQEKEFFSRVVDLRGEWIGEELYLKGALRGVEGSGSAASPVGCRLFYSKYPAENPPCSGCPIEYHGYHEFGQEVVETGDLSLRVPGGIKGGILFFKVHLLGPGGSVGPASNRVRVADE
ncbi:MAG: hypothetical protein JRJ06_01300 [Deltaproteobacteria bacterium]|nr:hypothetical protein [Deltaproteobacteria bacterium]